MLFGHQCSNRTIYYKHEETIINNKSIEMEYFMNTMDYSHVNLYRAHAKPRITLHGKWSHF